MKCLFLTNHIIRNVIESIFYHLPCGSEGNNSRVKVIKSNQGIRLINSDKIIELIKSNQRMGLIKSNDDIQL